MALDKVCFEIRKKPEYLKKFEELKNYQERIKFTYNICKIYLSNFKFKRSHKCNEKSFLLMRSANEGTPNQSEIWSELKLANESLAFAADKTKQRTSLILRSKILLSLNHPDESSEDMLTAINLTDPEDRTNAVPDPPETVPEGPSPDGFLRTQYLIGSGDLVPLDRKRSSFFDSASESVGLGYSDSCERHLVAQNDIRTGEVLIVEKPYASVLLWNCVYTHCAHCFRRCLRLAPCSNCCFAMFCGPQCERKSREGYHGVECQIADILFESRVGRMELLALRLLICASSQGRGLEELRRRVDEWEDLSAGSHLTESSQCYSSSDFMNIYRLVTNSDARTASDLFNRCVVSAALVHLLSKHTKFFSHVPAEQRQSFEVFCVGLVFHFMQSLPCNAHEISEFTDEGLVEIGAGIYATLSLVNHSCDPNVVRHSSGDSIVLRAIKPIKEGEQIFDNYGYHYVTHTRDERKRALLEQYYFECKCDFCCGLRSYDKVTPAKCIQFKNGADEEVYKKLTEKFEINLENTIQGVFDTQTLKELAEYLDYLDEFVLLPWQDFNKCQEALKHCWSFSGNHFRRSKALAK